MNDAHQENFHALEAMGDTPGSDVCGCTRVMLAEVAKCPDCDGDGWYVGHDDDCYEQGDCVCSGVQIQCERCGGTGRLA